MIPTEGDTREIAGWIWRELVPKSGQSDSVQGELLRAVEKLCWEAQNNGNGNWDSGFERLLDFLDRELGNCDALPAPTRSSFLHDTARLRNFEPAYLEDDLYDRLTDSVVEFSRLYPNPIQRTHDPELHR